MKMKKKIGILGSGVVAKTLGSGFIKYGYDVMLGTRDSSKLSEWQGTNSSAKVGTFDAAAQHGDIAVLAVGGGFAQDVLDLAGKSKLSGKTIIDATNPIAKEAPENGVLKFFTDLDRSLMEELQAHVSEANFVKAFNSVGSAYMVDPGFDLKPSMFICGNSEDAKDQVRTI